MASLPRLPVVVVASLLAGLALSSGCEPRHRAKAPVAGTAVSSTVAPTATPAPTPTPTPAPTPAPTPTPTPAPTATTPPPTGTWPTPTAMPGMDPGVLGEIAKKAAEMGLPVPGGAPAAPAGDPLDAALKASAAKYAPGFTAATPVGRAKLKQGEHAGMNVDMEQGKCYVVLGAGGSGITQLGLNLLFPVAPPQATLASDAAHGASPVLGEGKPLCPPTKTQVRVDTVPLQGTGDVAVQVFVK